jgi:glutathione S-transferase
MMPPLLAMLIVHRMGLLGRPARAPVQKMLDGHLDWLETELAGRPWFAGDGFTAADIMMSFPLEACRHRAGLSHGRPNLIDWLERIHARPAYGAALQKGGPLCLCLTGAASRSAPPLPRARCFPPPVSLPRPATS